MPSLRRRDRSCHTIGAAAIVAFTARGSTALRVARERPEAPIIGFTPSRETAQRLAVVWGVHAVISPDVDSLSAAVLRAIETARSEGFADAGAEIIVTAGVPFGKFGNTNVLRVAQVE